MITCNLMGGLGNQLFQIFATISCAIETNNQFKFLNIKTLGSGNTTIRNTYWDTMLSRLKFSLIENLPVFKRVFREKDFTYNNIIIENISEDISKNDIMIYGYFQSYKYFENNYNTIYKIIKINQLKTDLLEKLNYVNEDLKNVISLHFRIGDYKNIQHVHPVMSKEYYERCLEYIKSLLCGKNDKFTILYFCEEVDIEDVNEIINYLSEKFNEFNFVRCDKILEDWEQLLLMSCCNHNIIANSSFSWWGAYLNEWNDKIVCYPSTWFGPNINHNTKDLCPIEWKCIKC